MKLVILGLLAMAGLYAQNSVQGPMVGWVFDGSGESIRGVLGIPGASTLGPKLDLGVALKDAAFSGDQQLGLALAGEDRQLHLFNVRRPEGPLQKLENAPAGANKLVLSPNGRAAAVLYSEPRKLLISSDLHDTTGAWREIAMGADEALGAFAISDDSTTVLAAIAGQAATVFDRDGNRWQLNVEGTPVSMAFLDGSQDALIATARGVSLVRSVTGNGEAKLIWEGNAVAVGATADRKNAVILDDNRSVRVVNMETGAETRLDCQCQATTVARMLSGSVFRLNELTAEPLWLVDLNGLEARVLFVPAIDSRAE